MKILKYLSIGVILLAQYGHISLFAYNNEWEYFPLFLPTQEQLILEKEYVQSYDAVQQNMPIHEGIEQVKRENNLWKQSIPIQLPSQEAFIMPQFLPETWGDIS